MAIKKKPQKIVLSHSSKKPVTKKTGMKFPEYDHKNIEKTTQKEWLLKNIYKTETTSKKKKYYVLDMFPYPSGAGLHVGHPRGYIASDVFARMKRMQGFNVLHPMGFDSFGLPAEQYAIQTGKNPNIFTEQLIKTYKKQLESIGFSYDWSREVATHRPEYYEWTQWIFLQIYNSWYDKTKNKARPIDDLIKIFEKSGNEKVHAACDANSVSFSAKEWKSWSEIEQQKILMNYRLAYEGYSEVNWCPELGTVLANDEIVDSATGPVSERGGYPVEKKSMRQWFMRITAYADRLIKDLEGLDWSSHIKEIQKNWIGKSEGSEIDFRLQSLGARELEKYILIELPKIEDSERMCEIVAHGWLQNNTSPETGFTKELLQKERGLVFPVPKEKIDSLKSKIQANPKNFFVAKKNNQIVGWLGFEIREDKKISFGVYIDLSFTGKGIGTMLIKQLFAAYPEFDYEIEVTKTNKAIELYKRFGFTIIEESKFFQKTVSDKNIYLPIYRMLRKKEDNQITVFTTRADTLFGVTYIVLAPEHPCIEEKILTLTSGVTNKADIQKYIIDSKKKSEDDRKNDTKEKTGIEIKGIKAINPANGEEVPVWIADYVLAGYGTGAVMAVPAHDERDFAFAKKYNLPVKEVVAQTVGERNKDARERNRVSAIIEKDGKILCEAVVHGKTKFCGDYILIGGGIENDEKPEDAIVREIAEETGVTNAQIIQRMGIFRMNWFSPGLQTFRTMLNYAFVIKLDDSQIIENKTEADLNWIPIDELIQHFYKQGNTDQAMMLERYKNKTGNLFTQEDEMVNSGKFSGLTSEQARKPITEFVGGKLVTKYKIRDAIFARQRYWGEPIPLIHTKDGTIESVKEKNLPLELPNVKSYAPSGTGESPLSSVKAWTTAGYETNTMPGWAGSSWYFLRYMDPKNKKVFADKKALTYWKDVDMYVGGQEHATGHLLYSRFWHKFLYDMGYVPTKEPFKALRNQGLIMATDGRKMSKRWGNVINPDDIVATYGADTLRVYEMFMGPFEASQPWSTESIIGSRRFVERVWRLGEKVATQSTSKSSEGIERSIHKAIKKVTEDIHSFGFNTAISAMMICVNDIENTLQKEGEALAVREYLMLIQILAPFAPHMSDTLWKQFGQKGSIHTASWPTHNPKKLIDQEMTIVVQVNGKVRAELRFDTGMQKELIEAHAFRDEKILPWIEGKEIKRVIYVPGKLINIVC